MDIFGLVVGGIALVIFTFLLLGAPAPWRWLPRIGAGLWLMTAFVGFTFIASAFVTSSMRRQASIDSQKLRLNERGNVYEFPISQIRALRHVVYPGSRLEDDLERPLRELFFRGRRTALQVQVPDGQVEFFHSLRESTVAWMVENVSRLIHPDRPPAAMEPVDESRADTSVIATKLYGKSRRLPMLGGILIGSIATVASGWYAYRGLSSLNWPSVQGRVVSSHYSETQGSKGDPHYEAEIKYTYEISGSTYTNDDLGFMRYPGDDVVKQLVTKHPTGVPITVYYNPSTPTKSIVIPGLGPMHWLLCGLSLMPLILISPLLLNRPTRQQEALAARYRVVTTAIANAWDEHIVRIRWSVPLEAWQHAIRNARRTALWMAVRVMGVTALAVWAAHHWLVPLLPPDVPWRFALWVVLGLAGLPMIGQLIQTLLVRPRPPEYGLSEDGLLCPSKEKPLIPWSQISSFSVAADSPLPQIRAISLHLKSGLCRKVTLPGGDADQKILSELSSRIPEGPPLKGLGPLTARDWAIGTCLAIAVSSLSYFSKWPAGQPLPIPWAFLLCFVAGPGTWMALALRGRRAGLGSLAVGLNMLTAIGLLLSAIARALVELHR
jgi:hypothetical protein